ncbi:MAG: DNA primase [bacterium]|nr:DNA primase [bacterium]
MESPVDSIKSKLDIIEFIGSFIELKKTGRNFKAVCPFHSEKTPSFVISPDRQIWHCFGSCQDGGDVIKFLMKWENITFYEAIKELAEKTGVKLVTSELADLNWQKKERFLNMNILVAEFYAFILHKSSYGKKALDYLVNRNINPQTMKTFQLGYSPSSWDSLMQFLKKKKFNEVEMYENGLLVKSERGRYYDRFRGRLMFPIKDPRGQILAFSGRSLDSKDPSAKYINTPETPIYHKRETLFGIQLARDAIKKEQNVYIVEGEFDMISPFQHGYENFVAIKGSALSHEQLLMIKRYTNVITLTLDTDSAGVEAMKRGIEEADRLDFEVNIVSFDYAKDPDEAVRKDLIQFKKTLKKPIPIYDYLIEIAQKKYPENNPFDKKKISEEVIPFMQRITNPIVQSFYIKKLALLLDVSESSIELMIRRMRKVYVSKPTLKPKSVEPSREQTIQQYLLSTLFQSEEGYLIADKLSLIIESKFFTQVSYQKIYDAYIEFKKSNPLKFDFVLFAKSLSDQLRPVFDELYLFASSDLASDKENVVKLAYEIKKNYYKHSLQNILAKSGEVDENGKKELSHLSNELKEVEKKLMTL